MVPSVGRLESFNEHYQTEAFKSGTIFFILSCDLISMLKHVAPNTTTKVNHYS